MSLPLPLFWFSRYFPVASTREMLAEWRPLLCVFDVVMQKAISNMELFLPTIMPPEEHGQAFRSGSLSSPVLLCPLHEPSSSSHQDIRT